MESASSVPKKVIFDELNEPISDEFESNKMSLADENVKTIEKAMQRLEEKIRNAQIGEHEPHSLKEFKEMLKTFEEYENKYLAEFCNLEKKHASLMKEKPPQGLEDKFDTGFEDIFEALESFKKQSHLYMSRINKTDDCKASVFDVKDKFEFEGENVTFKPKDAKKIAKAVKDACQAKIAKGKVLICNSIENQSDLEAETSFIEDPSNNDDFSDEDDSDFLDDASEFECKTNDNDQGTIIVEDEEGKWEGTATVEVVKGIDNNDGTIIVEDEDAKWEGTASLEVVVHDSESQVALTQNEVVIRRPELFSTFDLMKRIFKAVFCFNDDEDPEDQRSCGLTFQEWMIVATFVIIFIACCIIIAFLGMRFRDCARETIAQANTIDSLMMDNEALNEFAQAVKYYNSTLYKVVKNEIIKGWDN